MARFVQHTRPSGFDRSFRFCSEAIVVAAGAAFRLIVGVSLHPATSAASATEASERGILMPVKQ